MKKIFFVISLLLVLFSFSVPVSAQTESTGSPTKEETLEAVVSKVIEEKKIEVMQKKQLYQKLELTVTKGSLKGNKIIIENGNIPLANNQKYYQGDRVFVSYSKDNKGNDIFYIRDYIRTNYLYLLFIIFIFLTILVAKKRGITSLLAMSFSFLIIFYSILPNILNGRDPVIAVIMASVFIVPVTFFLSHGFNKKTVAAILSSIIALIIVGILSVVFIELTKLTGFSSEEAGFLQIFKQGAINMKGILLAGIIIGALGVLDDITVSQAAVVFQLKETNKKLTEKELYQQATNVGQDHISSMVNTLVLVYAGAALPLFLLFVNNPHPFSETINYEIIAEEIVRTLVGSIGLILSVPIATFIACRMAVQKE
jgi:uncharacterized membrane protein